MGKNVYNINIGQIEKFKICLINSIDNSNHTVDDVDQVDQLCGSYDMDQWIQNHK